MSGKNVLAVGAHADDIEIGCGGTVALQANEENTITPMIVIYEVYKKIKQERGEEVALKVYAQLIRTKTIPLNEEMALIAADVSLKFGLGMADSIIYATAKLQVFSVSD